ncbi:MAG TPA: ATP-grasp domain-containing protein [Candidatus Angelobacter sp.]
MAPRIIFIESNTSGTGRLFASTALRLGFDSLLITENPDRYPYVQQDRLDFIRQRCADNIEALDNIIAGIAAKREIAGIYSSSEYFIDASAELALRRGLPGPDPGVVRTCRNKWRQYESLRIAGVAVPGSQRVDSVQDALRVLTFMALPVVLKPVFGTGSVGVRLCRTRSEVEDHATELLAVTTNERGMPVTQELLMQEYVQWPEFSAEMFSGRLMGITRKHTSAEPYFVETGHDFPVKVSGRRLEILTATLQRAASAVGMSWGPLHIEFRWDGDNLIIMEINPRLAGGFIPELVRLSTGTDLVEQTILLVAGQKTHLTPSRSRYSCIRFVCPESEGVLACFTGLDDAGKVPGVVDVQAYKTSGASFTVHHDFRDRIGHVISCGKSEEEALGAAEAAIDVIAVEMSSESLVPA